MNSGKDEKELLFLTAIELAYEAGKWHGQVELEDHFDNEQYALSALESINAKKTSMPFDRQSSGRTVKINLRSEKWRDGVIKSSEEYKLQALRLLQGV
ncbi:MAG: hypothetical protein QM504_08130 [Pseudomonadota bacterium]